MSYLYQARRTVSNNGRTPEHTAALHGHLAVLKVLNDFSHLSNNITRQDSCGTTPFIDAIKETIGHFERCASPFKFFFQHLAEFINSIYSDLREGFLLYKKYFKVTMKTCSPEI